MTPTETLRKAAALMRSRAEAATPGPWTKIPGASNVWHFPDEGASSIVAPGNGAHGYHVDPANAEHIAGMDPAVALAVADLIECPCPAHADALATAYLGGHDDIA